MSESLRSYVIASVLYYTGYASYYVLLKPRVYDLGGSYLALLLLDSIPAGLGLTSVLWGWWADRTSRKHVLRWGFLGSVVLLLLAFAKTPPQILVLVAGVSLFHALVLPVISTVFSLAEKPGVAFGYYAGAQGAGWAIGGGLSGILVERIPWGYTGVYAFAALCFGLAIALFYRTYPEHVPDQSPRSLPFQAPFPAIFWTFLTAVFLLYLGIMWGYGLLSIRLYEVLGGSKTWYGLIWATIPAGLAVLTSPFYGRWVQRIGPRPTLVFLGLLYTTNMLALTLLPGWAMILLWVIPLWNLLVIGVNSLATELSGDEHRSQALGMVNTIINLATGLAFLGGLGADRFGRTPAVYMAVLLTAFSIIPAFALLQNLRKRPTSKPRPGQSQSQEIEMS